MTKDDQRMREAEIEVYSMNPSRGDPNRALPETTQYRDGSQRLTLDECMYDLERRLTNSTSTKQG